MKLSITYMKRLKCSYEDLKADFLKAWPKLGQLSARRNAQNAPSQYELWQEFVCDNVMVHRQLVQLVKIMLSCFANSSPIERSYSHLAKICEKHRNRMLEDTMSTLYMLKVLGVKPKSADEYHDVIAVMEGRD